MPDTRASSGASPRSACLEICLLQTGRALAEALQRAVRSSRAERETRGIGSLAERGLPSLIGYTETEGSWPLVRVVPAGVSYLWNTRTAR